MLPFSQLSVPATAKRSTYFVSTYRFIPLSLSMHIKGGKEIIHVCYGEMLSCIPHAS